MKINGTLFNYYFHCKKQCYLHGNRINMEDVSELVKIGKELHEDRGSNEVSIDNIKIDKIQGEYLVEYKKSNADIEAARWQILYYLYILNSKGIDKKGKLICFEKKINKEKIYEVELDEDLKKEIEQIKQQIIELLNMDRPPIVNMTSKCKKCSYYSYCVI